MILLSMHPVVAAEKCITFFILLLFFSVFLRVSLFHSPCFIVESLLISFFSKLLLMCDMFCNSAFSVVMGFSKLTIAVPLSLKIYFTQSRFIASIVCWLFLFYCFLSYMRMSWKIKNFWNRKSFTTVLAREILCFVYLWFCFYF